MPHVLSIDQGTTSTRAVIYDDTGRPRGSAQREFRQSYPQPGWVEHDAAEIWRTVAITVGEAIRNSHVKANDLAAIGITNQRETVVLWDRASGEPVAPAIVWQDRRTADFCRQRKSDEPWLTEKTGLVLDPYFSATKLRWLLEQDAGLRRRAVDGSLAAGTIDSWLLWKLTGGRSHVTDASNASRTLLLDIHRVAWDADLCRFFDIPPNLLPQVRPSVADFGVTADLGFVPAGVPIRGIAGDQQAALFGQGGYRAGDAKCTYGTGAFFLVHTGDRASVSRHRLLTSLTALVDATPQYVLEGSVFVAGAAVQWLRDGLQFITTSSEVENLAARSDPQQPIVFVPAFVGLGAPYWAPDTRGVIFGLTRNTTAADLARGALEGVALQVADLVDAADQDAGQTLAELRVDGGMARNATFLQMQADLLGRPVRTSPDEEATARGAAFLAGLGAGVWPSTDALTKLVHRGASFLPRMDDAERRRQRERWRRALKSVLAFYEES
jgi:glycerol kinase